MTRFTVGLPSDLSREIARVAPKYGGKSKLAEVAFRGVLGKSNLGEVWLEMVRKRERELEALDDLQEELRVLRRRVRVMERELDRLYDELDELEAREESDVF